MGRVELSFMRSLLYFVVYLFSCIFVYIAQRARFLYFFVMLKRANWNDRCLYGFTELIGYLLDFFMIIKPWKVVNIIAWLIVIADFRSKIWIRKHDSLPFIKLKHVGQLFLIIVFGTVLMRTLLLTTKAIKSLWTLEWVFHAGEFLIGVVLGAEHMVWLMVGFENYRCNSDGLFVIL